MPTYQYFCKKCNHEFEEKHLVVERELPKTLPCPSCNEKDSVDIYIKNISIGDPIRLGIRKPDKGMQQVLTAINNKYKTNMPVY